MRKINLSDVYRYFRQCVNRVDQPVLQNY